VAVRYKEQLKVNVTHALWGLRVRMNHVGIHENM
jgi:hypothetical protein